MMTIGAGQPGRARSMTKFERGISDEHPTELSGTGTGGWAVGPRSMNKFETRISDEHSTELTGTGTGAWALGRIR